MRKGQCGPGPQKCKCSLFLACIAEVAGIWKSQFLKTSTSKMMEPGGILQFSLERQNKFQTYRFVVQRPQYRARTFRDVGRVAGKSSPIVSFCSSQLATSACPSRERLGNPNTRGAYPPCTSLPLLELGPAGPPDKEPLHFRRTGFNHVLPGLKLYATHLLAWAG